MHRSIFLCLSFSVYSTLCYECPKGIDTIDPPSDTSKPIYYPSNWTEGQPVPALAPNQHCFTYINVPTGYFANVTFYRNFPTSSGSYVVYPSQKITRILNDDPYPFIFTPPQFKVNFQSDNSTDNKLAFKIQWTKFPMVGDHLINIDKGNPPTAVLPRNELTTFIALPNSQASVMAFSLVDPSLNHLLRQSAIFGGDSFNSQFIGTLDDVLASRQPIIAYKNRISVYTFNLGNYFNYPLFMGQDFSDTRRYSEYIGENCPNTGSCSLILDGSFGDSLTVTEYDGPEFILGFDSFPDTATINVYENRVLNTTRVASMTSSNYRQHLPFRVNGHMKFYELKGHGVYNMTVTRNFSV